MVRKMLAVLCLVGLLAPCLAADATTPIPVADYKGTIKIACVGDSITYGAGVKDRAKNAYPFVLGRLLGDKWEVRNFGVSGATLLRKGDKPYEKQKAFQQALDFKPDVLIVKLGTNDTKPQNWKHQDQFEADYKWLIEQFRKANPEVRVYLCLPVPAFPGNWGINDKTIREGVIPAVRKLAKECQTQIIDLYAALEGKKELVPDKVHPNAEGAAIMARTVYKALTKKDAPAEQK